MQNGWQSFNDVRCYKTYAELVSTSPVNCPYG